MDVTVPHAVVYETEGRVPIDRVIESLQANRNLLLEAIPVIEALVPDLKIERISISVGEISNQSPLREVFFATLIIAFQSDLSKEVPPLVQELTGVTTPASYNTLLTVVAMLILFYGMDAAYRLLSKRLGISRASRQLDGIVADISRGLGVPEEKIKKTLHERYTKGRLQRLMETAVGFGSPSKGQNNAPIRIGDRKLEQEEVAEIPAIAQPLEEEGDKSDPFENVEIELHAQDIDRAKQGWAGIPKGHATSRLRMELYPPITPDELWGKSTIRGDIILMSHQKDGRATPYMFHLVRLRD